MKKSFWSLFVLLLLSVGLTGCKRSAGEATDESSDSLLTADSRSLEEVIEEYLVKRIGSYYLQGEHCVPFCQLVEVNDSNSQETLVWGDFWLYHYDQEEDTLMMVSGGNHAGLIHLIRENSGYVVTAFDEVADGSDNETSARRIFGDRYEAFSKIQSNDKQREQVRVESLANYIRKNGLSVHWYKDADWPAHRIPLE